MKLLIILLAISINCNAEVSSAELNGLWKVKKLSCSDGSESSFIKRNQALYANGITEETLQIQGDRTVYEMKNWSKSKKSYCIQKSEETWKITNSEYQVQSRNLLPVENHGRKCPVLSQVPPSQVNQKFELLSNELKLFGNYAERYLRKENKQPCASGNLVWTYIRI